MKSFLHALYRRNNGTVSVESAGMREAIKQMKPNKFDDIVALVAYIDQAR